MRKNFNKLATLALSGMMVMSMAMPAFAADKVINFHKVLHTDGKTLAPQTTFNFTIKPVAAGSTYNYKYKDPATNLDVATSMNTIEAPSDAVTIVGATFEPEEGNLGTNIQKDGNNEVIGAQFESDAKITVKEDKFTKYGLYAYDINELNEGYEGIRYATATYKLYVYKYRNEKANKDEFSYNVVRATDWDGTNANVVDKSGVINNIYGKHTPPNTPEVPPETPPNTPPNTPPGTEIPPNNSTHDVEIVKKVIGSLSTPDTAEFEFTVTVTPGSNKAVTQNKKEMYHVESVGAGYNSGVKSFTAGESKTFTVKHGQGIHIFGLTKNDKIKIVEGTNEYVMTVKEDKEETAASLLGSLVSTSATKTAELTVKADKAKVQVENKKEGITPTGIVMNVAPYAMMLAVAGGLGVVFVNRKKEEE